MRAQDLIEHVIRPTLEYMGMYSEAAENLLIGTAMQESRLKYLHQVSGPAIGLWQMEPATHDDLYTNFIDYKGALKALVRSLAGSKYANTKIDPDEMHGNLYYACAMARLQYYRQKEPLPYAEDIHALSRYYKKYYNTPLGKATLEQFIESYHMAIA